MNLEKFFRNGIVVCLLAFVCCALWGSAFPCIKLGYIYSNIDSSAMNAQILYAGIRFTIAGVMAIIIGSVFGRKVLMPKKKSVPKILWLCFLQTVLQYTFFYIGLAHTTGVKASIIEAVNVFVAIFVAAFIFHQEKLSAFKLIGCVIGFAGVVLINLSGGGSELSAFSLLGDGFIFLSTVSYAFSSVFLKRYSKEESPILLSGYQFVLGGLIMAAAGYILGGRITFPDAKAVMMLLYLAFVSAVAYSLWGVLLKYNDVSRVAVYGFMNPVCGVILSFLLLDEGSGLGIISILSLLLVCVGIYICNKKQSNN